MKHFSAAIFFTSISCMLLSLCALADGDPNGNDRFCGTLRIIPAARPMGLTGTPKPPLYLLQATSMFSAASGNSEVQMILRLGGILKGQPTMGEEVAARRSLQRTILSSLSDGGRYCAEGPWGDSQYNVDSRAPEAAKVLDFRQILPQN